MKHHPRHRDNMYVSRAVQAERDRKTAEAHEYYRRLVRARARGDASPPEPEAAELAESPAAARLPSQNARKHGLCAETLGVEPEENEVFNDLLEQLRAEYQPAGPTEEILVRDLWRHACFLHLCARAESGYFRHVYARATDWAEYKDRRLPEPGLTLSEIVGNDRAPVIARYRRTHERAFLEVQKRLMELRAWRDAQARIDPPVLPATAVSAVDAEARDALLQHFSRDEDCVEYIRRYRQRKRGPVCPQCRKKPMEWRNARRLWQCHGCLEQVTPRTGTLMERSRTALSLWFGAIVHLIFEPDMHIAELQKRLALPRQATATKLRGRILRRLPHMGTPEERLETCVFVK